jgi:hypothetical protein
MTGIAYIGKRRTFLRCSLEAFMPELIKIYMTSDNEPLWDLTSVYATDGNSCCALLCYCFIRNVTRCQQLRLNIMEWLTDREWWTGRYVEGIGATEEKTKKRFSQVSRCPVEIRIDHLLNTSQQKLSLEPTCSIACTYLFMAYIPTLSLQRRMVGWLKNGQLRRMWKEVTVTYFKVIVWVFVWRDWEHLRKSLSG